MTQKEGYSAMYLFLENWYKITKSEDIGELLSLMEFLDDGGPVDSAMWEYWEDAMHRVKSGDEPSSKKLI
ncbi:hypothetical protein [Penaeicola halotolerans]|uniref:hypothetical protein n=1 Tax=Penaeicola halotolerans TaxID=2793196 RepID=UPI001CF8ECB0|nr:hypothetical protein [Penaeicola halotolerans]